MNTPTSAIAVLNGILCQVAPNGARRLIHQPMGGAVAEFLPGPLCYFVREQAFGLLPGLPNLYCLDAGFHLLWVAEWPTEAGLCTALCGVENGELIATAGSGAQVRIEAATGRLLRVASTLAVAG